MSTYEKLLEYAWNLQIIDTHEHLSEEQDWAKSEHDVLSEYLIHYFKVDVISAGLSPQDYADHVANPKSSKSLIERWQLVEPYWHAARNTGYGRALDLAVGELYSLDGITADTIEELNQRFTSAKQASADGTKSHYEYVLKEKSKIAVSIKDSDLETDRQFFVSTGRLDHLIMPASADDLLAGSGHDAFPITCFDDLLEVAERQLDYSLDKGMVCLKCGLAYSRSLMFPRVTRESAEREFNLFFTTSQEPENARQNASTQTQNLENYMMHHCLRLANRHGLTYQFHTGILEGTGNKLGNSDRELMCNLFSEYQNVTFDLFHMGYPYQHKIGALAKMFPNVMIDMCWAHIISPEASVRALVEWLDAVPANKISAFGGDYCFPDGVYGHAVIARENIAKALAEKVEKDCFDLDRAREICRWVFVENPKRIFNLKV